MPRSVWSGSLAFGLVNVPVKVYTASKDRSVSFHWLHDKDGARIRNQRICPKEDTEVSREEIVKGYEVAPEQYVLVTDDELKALEPSTSKTIDIEAFVGLEEVDPVYFDRPYYLVPGETAGHAYGLLMRALQETGKVAIGRIVMRRKEYLVTIRVRGERLVMETMRYPDELVPAEEAAGEAEIKVKDLPEKELEMATRLVGSLATDFDPSEYHDRYRERVLEFIRKKAEGEEVVVEPEAEAKPATQDILAALEESLRKAEGEMEAEAS